MKLEITVQAKNQSDKLIWSLADTQTLQMKSWALATVTINADIDHRILIEATTTTKHTNFIGKYLTMKF